MENSASTNDGLIVIGDYPFELTYMHYDTSKYEEQLQKKIKESLEKLPSDIVAQIHDTNMTIIRSPIKYFRQRIRLGVKEYKGKLCYVMWEGGSPSVIVESFPIAAENIYRCSADVLQYVDGVPELSVKLRAVHYLSSLTGELIISLIYERPLIEDSWRAAAQLLRDRVKSRLDISIVNIIGRAAGVCVTIGTNRLTEKLHLSDGRSLSYIQIEDGFSNPNAHVNEKALDWICGVVRLAASSRSNGMDLLELYCGNGNHTVAIAAFARRIVAVELNKSLCNAADENLAANQITNVLVVPCDSAKFAQRILRAKRYVHRVKRPPQGDAEAVVGTGIRPEGDDEEVVYDFSTVLVDPPRQGLDPDTRRMIAAYDTIVYISCSPDSLARDLRELQQTHDLERYAVFDQFSYTPHLESGVMLTKKK